MFKSPLKLYIHISGNPPDCFFLLCFKKTWFFAILNEKVTVKKLSFQVSSAKLERSYRRAPKGAREGETAAAGICHLCMAGTPGPGLEWEDKFLSSYTHTQQFPRHSGFAFHPYRTACFLYIYMSYIYIHIYNVFPVPSLYPLPSMMQT